MLGAGWEKVMLMCVGLLQIFTPAPDNLVTGALDDRKTRVSLDTRGGLDGLATPGGAASSSGIR